ncbi:hypothetical protein D3C72_1640420 [compost metagenome]
MAAVGGFRFSRQIAFVVSLGFMAIIIGRTVKGRLIAALILAVVIVVAVVVVIVVRRQGRRQTHECNTSHDRTGIGRG